MENGILISGMAWITLLVELVFTVACIYVASVARKRGIVANAAWLLAGGAGLMFLFDCIGAAGGTAASVSPDLGNVSALAYLLSNVVGVVAFLAMGVAFLLFKPVRGGPSHG
jgi:hypothetical protein